MGLGKKTINLIEKLLNDPIKRQNYSREELLYMEKQLPLLKKERQQRRERKLRQRQQEKGFSQ